MVELASSLLLELFCVLGALGPCLGLLHSVSSRDSGEMWCGEEGEVREDG